MLRIEVLIHIRINTLKTLLRSWKIAKQDLNFRGLGRSSRTIELIHKHPWNCAIPVVWHKKAQSLTSGLQSILFSLLEDFFFPQKTCCKQKPE